MADDTNGIDKGWDTLSQYAEKSADADDAVTVSLSTTPGEWLVNTAESVVLPMSMAEVVGGLRAGKLSERSLVWRAGMQEWAPIEKVPQLKLAARLPLSKPPPKPARATPMPAPTPIPPQVGLSRKSTLPFGIPAQRPASHPSNPAQRKLTPLPRPAAAAPAPSDEPKVLAVYERPAPTISFELDRADSTRAPIPAPPETLAPTTSDTQPRIRAAAFEPPGGSNVVAAGQFEALQRSAKRWVVASSLASAAAASLLTFWLSHRAAPAPSALTAPAAVQAPSATAALAPAPNPPAPAPSLESAPASSAAAPAPSAEAAEKPAKKARAPRAVTRPRTPVAPANPDAPSAEPNPYDLKLEEDAPSSAKKPAATDSAPKEVEAPATSGSPSPGL
jgi:hypothetical protein